MRIAILSNDVVPGMGVPVAAPGIRAWGMAEGLRSLGHEVTVIIEPRLVRTVWSGALPPVTPRGCLVLGARKVADYVSVHGTEALIICNSNHGETLGDLGSCRLVYDFFAPKVLELTQNVALENRDEALAKVEQRKLAALARSDAVAVNGAKKLPYVQEWLERSGVPELPCAVVNPGIPRMLANPPEEGPLRVMVSGYLQPWSRPGAWASAVRPLLDAGVLKLDLLVARHWGQRNTREPIPAEMQQLFEHPGVSRHDRLRFGDFRRLLGGNHLSIDVFARNPEREIAMVTRSVVALATGVPVMHVPFTEVSPWIENYDAGWLVEEDDAASMAEVLWGVIDDRAALRRAREGALAVADEILDPVVAAAPLEGLLEAIR